MYKSVKYLNFNFIMKKQGYLLLIVLFVTVSCQKQNGTFSGKNKDIEAKVKVKNVFGLSTKFNVVIDQKVSGNASTIDGKMIFQSKTDINTTNYTIWDSIRLSYDHERDLFRYSPNQTDTIILKRED